jgi:hypothetical protein
MSEQINYDDRYTYWRIVDKYGCVILVRDDGYRFAFLMESNPNRKDGSIQEGLDEWVFMMEYKHCNFGGVAQTIVDEMVKALVPAPIETINKKHLEL